MKRWFRRIGYGAGALACLLILFIAAEHFRGKWALNRRLSALKARGEVLSVAALKPKRPNTDQNISIALISLSNRLESVLSRLENSPPNLLFAAPGRAIVAWQLNEWSRDGKESNDWKMVGAELSKSIDLLNLIEEAAEKPAYDSGIDYEKGFVDYQLPPIVTIKRAALLLNIASVYELNEGHLEAAHDHLVALVKLVADQKPEPLLICQLVRHACGAFAFNATWEALQAPGWTEAQLASLQAAWEVGDFPQDMALALEMERALELDFFDQVRTSKAKLTFVVNQRETARENSEGLWKSFGTHGLLLKHFNVPLWRMAWADQDELRTLNFWQETIERDRIARTNSWAKLSSHPMKRQSEPGWYERFRFLFSAEPSLITDNMIRKGITANIQQQMVITAIAIHRYALRAGKLPPDLSALVPGFLRKLPCDGMDGKNLRYRVVPDGHFVLYSVGEDGQDDGGDPTLREDKKTYKQIWDGRDALWPTAATKDEAARALKDKAREK